MVFSLIIDHAIKGYLANGVVHFVTYVGVIFVVLRRVHLCYLWGTLNQMWVKIQHYCFVFSLSLSPRFALLNRTLLRRSLADLTGHRVGSFENLGYSQVCAQFQFRTVLCSKFCPQSDLSTNLKRRLHIQFVKRFGILFGSNIVPLWSKKFGKIFVQIVKQIGCVDAS